MLSRTPILSVQFGAVFVGEGDFPEVVFGVFEGRFSGFTFHWGSFLIRNLMCSIANEKQQKLSLSRNGCNLQRLPVAIN